MIFVRSQIGATLFLMLTEKDLEVMRTGNTRFVDKKLLQGEKFTDVVLSLHKDDAEAMKIIKQADPKGFAAKVPSEFQLPEKNPDQVECPGCKAFVSRGALLEDRCIVCWRTMAKSLGRLAELKPRDSED